MKISDLKVTFLISSKIKKPPFGKGGDSRLSRFPEQLYHYRQAFIENLPIF
jgi:hypothetical protein